MICSGSWGSLTCICPLILECAQLKCVPWMGIVLERGHIESSLKGSRQEHTVFQGRTRIYRQTQLFADSSIKTYNLNKR